MLTTVLNCEIPELHACACYCVSCLPLLHAADKPSDTCVMGGALSWQLIGVLI